MPNIVQSVLSFLLRLRRGRAMHLVRRLLLLLGLGLVAYGNSLICQPPGNGAEPLARQAMDGLLLVIFGAALVAAVLLWRD